MTKTKDKSKLKEFFRFAQKQISKEYRRIDIINKKPDKIAIALLLLSSNDEATEMLRAVNSADNIEGSQIKGVSEELSRLSERIQILLKTIKSV